MASSERQAYLFITTRRSMIKVIKWATLGLCTSAEIKRLIFYLHNNNINSYSVVK